MYDPMVGRFLSADPVLQAPENFQNYNRYSYCLNNPLKYTDPTGYQVYNYGVLVGSTGLFTSTGLGSGGGGGSRPPKLGAYGSGYTNLDEYDMAWEYYYGGAEAAAAFANYQTWVGQFSSGNSNINSQSSPERANTIEQLAAYMLKVESMGLEGWMNFQTASGSDYYVAIQNGQCRLYNFTPYVAKSQGGSRGGDELLIELNIKFGVGYESSFNLGGFGVKGKASATMDYMTFRLTEKGFQYIPYRKATIEGSFGHAMLNGGVKMEHNGYNSQWSANGTIANFDLSTGAAPMITPISFGYQMPIGFGVDFKFGVDMYSAFESFDRLDRVHRQVTGVGIWHGPKY